MKAAVWTDIEKIEIKDLPIPRAGEGEVVIKVKAAGVCATDAHIYIGAFKHATTPHVLGHEICGVISQVGEGVEGISVGERVILNTVISCGKCIWCKSGRNEMCPNGKEIGYNPYNGGYEEYVLAPQSCVVKIPDSISFEEGAILESIICPAGSILRYGMELGSTVFVQGGGPAGIGYIQLSKACGASKVIASVRGAERIAFARQFGADVVIDAANEDVYSRVMEETDGLGARYSIDAAGSVSSVEMAVRACANGGDVTLYGIPDERASINFPVVDIVLRQINIHGACGNYLAWDPLVSMVESGRINVKDMITHRFSLDNLPEALKLIKNREKNLIKSVIVMED